MAEVSCPGCTASYTPLPACSTAVGKHSTECLSSATALLGETALCCDAMSELKVGATSECREISGGLQIARSQTL